MERTLTQEEKIKRAEEIYLRRKSNENGYGRRTATVNVSDQKNYGLLKKVILQMLICLVIYFIFYLIQNSNYIFSEEVLNRTKEVLSYDIDLSGIYEMVVNFFSEDSENILVNGDTNNLIEDTNSINEESNAVNNDNTNVVNNISQIEGGIGGAEVEETALSASIEKTSFEKDLNIETDEEYIKNNFSLIIPVKGIVSSEFGIRNVDNPIVSKNHAGIDIAANTGTDIYAAMEGKVVICSTTGDYGYHIKIENKDVTTLYAHCSKLCVKKGDYVSKGQKIAEVGSTGKTTGPHLHFEIARNGKYINPRSILDF